VSDEPTPLTHAEIIDPICESYDGNNYADAAFIGTIKDQFPKLITRLATAESEISHLRAALEEARRALEEINGRCEQLDWFGDGSRRRCSDRYGTSDLSILCAPCIATSALARMEEER
jgi:hypothetical protein